ncbi:MAG: flagellar hook-basal body complex protein FliE [Burkholderiaceae bacterium]|nr:flagellar hook-basal body complex protein FliE [Burkholderiaceae bacterium]
MSVEGINQVLSRMQAMQEMAASGKSTVDGVGSPLNSGNMAAMKSSGVDFGQVLKQAVQEVSDAQNTAQAKAQAFQMGAKDMSLEEVMVSLQKANVAFQGMIAVRNKLVEAYRDVTNLQV